MVLTSQENCCYNSFILIIAINSYFYLVGQLFIIKEGEVC